MINVGAASLQPGRLNVGGAAGSFGGEVDGSVARQNGTSTWSNQSDGEGGDGGEGGAGGAGGGNGPLDHVVHFGSAVMLLIWSSGRKYAGPSFVSCENPPHLSSAVQRPVLVSDVIKKRRKL
jgi:hypothetical protein